jgi:hypothetical protein
MPPRARLRAFVDIEIAGAQMTQTFRHLAALAAAALMVAALPRAQAAAAHAHGAAELDVAVDGPTISLQLRSPLDSLLGFERAPRNDAERERVRVMARALREGNPFVPTAAARCRLDRVTLASPVLAPELLGERGSSAPGGAADDHAELEAGFVYRCEDAAALRGLDVMLFDHFKRLQRVDARVAGPKGQSAAKLSWRARQLRW